MSDQLLRNKRGIVLGVANERSIAWACAKACHVHGATLAFNYLGDAQEKRVRKLLEELPGAPCYPCDVTNDAEIRTFFHDAAVDGLDFIIHSVAYADRNDLKGRFVDTSRQNFAMALDISAYSLVAVAKAAEPYLRHNASIVAMTYYGSEKVIPKYNVMGVAKATLEACARYLAEDLGPTGVRVNCISAGPLRTLSSAAFPGFRTMLDLTEKVAPLRRNITQEDVANATLYLVSDLSTGVTGEVLHVDSGYHALGMFAPAEPEE